MKICFQTLESWYELLKRFRFQRTFQQYIILEVKCTYVNEVFEARLALESLDEEPNETSNEASELPQKNTEPSRIKRIKHLFAEAVALVHTNKEDLENSEGLVQSKPASESEPNKETQGDWKWEYWPYALKI